MKLKPKELAKEIGCCVNTLQIYICRSEFSHIKYLKDNKHFAYYDNVEKSDINKIKKLILKNIKE